MLLASKHEERGDSRMERVLERRKVLIDARAIARNAIRGFRSQRGVIDSNDLFNLLFIALIAVSAVIPTVLNAINDTDTSGWTTAEVALFGILGIAVLYGVLKGIVALGNRGGAT